MTDKEYIVPCECGLVKKIQYGKHYICPLDIPTCSRIWAKELFSDRYRNLHENIKDGDENVEENQLSSGGLDQECPIQTTASEPELFTNTHEDGSSASVLPTNQVPTSASTSYLGPNAILKRQYRGEDVIVQTDRTGHCCCFCGSFLFTLSILIILVAVDVSKN